MWVYINKNNVEDYLCEHQDLAEDWPFYNLVETKDAIFVPRLFHTNYPSKHLVIHNGKKQVENEKTDFKFTGKLRPEQIPIVNTVIDSYKKNGFCNGILKCRPGIGKRLPI